MISLYSCNSNKPEGKGWINLFNGENLDGWVVECKPEDKVKVFEETGDIDFGYEIPGLARYRANFFEQKYGVAAVFRQIPEEILTAEQLGLPPVIPKLSMLIWARRS